MKASLNKGLSEKLRSSYIEVDRKEYRLFCVEPLKL